MPQTSAAIALLRKVSAIADQRGFRNMTNPFASAIYAEILELERAQDAYVITVVAPPGCRLWRVRRFRFKLGGQRQLGAEGAMLTRREGVRLVAGAAAGALYDLHVERRRRFSCALNAVVIETFERGRREAAAADRRLAAGERAPLLGLPMTLKESEQVAGLPQTAGLEPLREHRPEADGRIATSVLRAGCRQRRFRQASMRAVCRSASRRWDPISRTARRCASRNWSSASGTLSRRRPAELSRQPHPNLSVHCSTARRQVIGSGSCCSTL